MESIGEAGVDFIYPYLNINDEKQFVNGLYKAIGDKFGGFKKSEIKRAVSRGLKAYSDWMADVRREGEAAIRYARAKGMRIMILAGRPYHVDPEIGHGIDKLATSLGFAVVTEDSIGGIAKPADVHVLNQWTYHARLYAAAEYACDHDDVQLVQLVSFGCGIDAVTTDEVRAILESRGKLYTQIKIDEITNLGAVTIRLRSLIGALDHANAKKAAAQTEKAAEEVTV
jgi:predicted nucleotide-binding protein (sugar kinase/HSP70/actin superfamily)